MLKILKACMVYSKATWYEEIFMSFINSNTAYSIVYNKSVFYRYRLEINTVQFPSNPVIVIMKNPSTTCDNLPNGTHTIHSYSDRKKCHTDRTTGRVYRYLKNQYDKIIILNLFPCYATNTINVNNHYVNNTSNAFIANDLEIASVLNSYPQADIVCAWGGKSQIDTNLYNHRIQNVSAMLVNRTLYQYDTAKKSLISYNIGQTSPLHGLQWK